ncbi:hypothetical protein LINPERPRIM_LOCUS34208 [Linum perenne]
MNNQLEGSLTADIGEAKSLARSVVLKQQPPLRGSVRGVISGQVAGFNFVEQESIFGKNFREYWRIEAVEQSSNTE